MIKPKRIRTTDITKAVDAALKAASKEVEVNFKLSYWNWDAANQPEWKIMGPRTKAGSREMVHETTSTPFVYVDQGTKGPYPIPAKNKPLLKWKSGFIAKTAPGRLVSQPGASFGGWRSAKEVTHPGIKPREISKQVADEVDENIVKHFEHYLKGV
jgi:hypothetical protein